MYMSKAQKTITLVFAGLILSSPALANPGQEQACAGEVSSMQDIPMGEVRVARFNKSRSGVSEVILEYPGGMARCMVDQSFNILDIRWNHRQGVSHKASVGANKSGQEQACAAYMAEQENVALSEVRVARSNTKSLGHLSVVVKVPGMTAKCNVDAHYNVVGFKFLGDVE
jgi:hypothetical protein